MVVNLPNRYELKGKCGSGRFATVYHAWDRELQRDIALKVSDLKHRTGSEQARIKLELRISCKLRHPHIASGFDGFEQGHQVVLSLPLLNGGTLAAPTTQQLRTFENKLTCFALVCEAVEYMHRSGLIHADLKPDNVLLNEAGTPFLADFGSCMSVKRPTNELVGTVAYLAPELVNANAIPNVSTDVYALGATLYYLLAGRPPFSGDVHAVLQAIRTVPFPDIRQVEPTTDRNVAAIVEKACHCDVKLRYHSVTELLDDVNRYLKDEPIAAISAGRAARLRLWAKRNPTMAQLAASIIAMICLGTSVSAIGWQRSADKRRALEASRTMLAEKAALASDHEQQLQQLLSDIRADQAVVEVAAANESRLLAESVAIRDQAAAESDKATQQLAEAQRLAGLSDSLRSEEQSVTAKLSQAENLLQRLDAYNSKRELRREVKHLFTQAIEVASKSPANYHRSGLYEQFHELVQAGAGEATNSFLCRTLRTFNEFKEVHWPVWELKLSKHFTTVVFNRTCSRALLLNGTNESEYVLFDKNSNAERKTIQWLNSDQLASRSGTPTLAGFSDDGMLVAAILHSGEGRYDVVEKETHGTDKSKIKTINFEGTIHSIRFLGDRRILLLRSDAKTGNVELFDVYSQKVLWSARSSRQELAGNSKEQHELPLLPFFIDVGTDPWQHMVFATSPRPSPDKLTHTCLHSVELDYQGLRSASTFDCGMQDLSTWPHQWQLSEEFTIGVGVKCLSTQDPPPVKNARFAAGARGIGSKDRLQIQACSDKWNLIRTSQVASDPPRNLESLLCLDWTRDPLKAWLAEVSQSNIPPVPTLDPSTGYVVLFADKGVSVFDLVDQQLIPLPIAYGVPANPIVVMSPNARRALAIDYPNITAFTFAGMSREVWDAYVPVESTIGRLAQVAKRMVGRANADEQPAIKVITESAATNTGQHTKAISLSLE